MTAAAGLLVAIVAADLLLFNTLRVALTRSVDDSARQGATEVAALIDANRLPNPVPVAAGTITIQVLDSAGQITDVSPGADRLVPLLTPAQAASSARTGQAVLLPGPPYGMPSLLRVAAVSAGNGDLVISAVPYSIAGDSLSVVAKALIFGTPLLFILFTGAIWLAVGSTIRPIALLRRGAARVTGSGVPRDLPVPEARDEVRSLALTLNDMLSRLAAAQQRQRDLVSDTAHELRSPIASIRTQLEVALDHPSGQDWPSTARDVHADVLRLARLAEDLLVLARLDEQALGAPRRAITIDLVELSRSVAERYAGARVPVVVRTPGTTDAEGREHVSGDSGVGVDRGSGDGAVGTGDNGAVSTGGAVGTRGDGAVGTRADGAVRTRADGAVGTCGCGVGIGAGGGAAGGTGRDDVVSAGSDCGGIGAGRESAGIGAGRNDGAAGGPGSAGSCLVDGERDGLDRLLVNLVDNAVRYAKSLVTVTVCREDDWVVLTVTDDGPGIPAADMSRAFDRFARLDTARSRDGDEVGAGLGLAIVRATAQAGGGDAHLEPSSPDSQPPGLRAVVRLPASGGTAASPDSINMDSFPRQGMDTYPR